MVSEIQGFHAVDDSHVRLLPTKQFYRKHELQAAAVQIVDFDNSVHRLKVRSTFLVSSQLVKLMCNFVLLISRKQLGLSSGNKAW